MNTQQETYYDEQEGVEYVYEQADPNHSGKSAVYIVGYFLLLAVLMIPASRFHLGMQGVFFAMIAAGLALLVGVPGVKFVKSRIEALRLTKKGFAQMMVGYAPEIVIETEPLSTPRGQRALVPVMEAAPDDDEQLPDTIIEENPLYLSDVFQPNINSVLGAMLLLVGIRRSGKSNLLAVLAEELGRYAVPLVIFDTEDEYSGLVSSQHLPRGFHVGSADVQGESSAATRYVALDTEGAYEFGKAELINGLNDWQQGRPNKERIPVMVMLDEATKWLPQNTGDSYVSKEMQSELHHAFFDVVVARGGKRGFSFVAACQRYSQINKNVLQSLWKFLFLQTEDADLTRYERLGLEREDVVSLRQGECFVFSPSVIGFRTMMRARYSPHMGHTPGLDDLFRHTRQLAPVQAVLSRSFSSAQIARPVAQPDRMEDMPVRRQKPKTDAERVLEAYNENPSASYRELGEKVGMGKDKVRSLIIELRERGLIKSDNGTENV